MMGSKKVVLGLDLSLTCSGVCVMSENNCRVASIKTKPSDGSKVERYEKILKGILEVIESDSEIYVAIENYTFKMNPKHTSSILTLAELGGVVKYAFRKLPLIVVSPGTLKLFMAGKGNAKKEDMKLAAFKKYGREFKNNDECDAFGLADLVGCALDFWDKRSLFEYEKRAIATVRKGNKEVFDG